MLNIETIINNESEKYKSDIENFELIQFKNTNSIINVISLSAKDEYKINELN